MSWTCFFFFFFVIFMAVGKQVMVLYHHPLEWCVEVSWEVFVWTVQNWTWQYTFAAIRCDVNVLASSWKNMWHHVEKLLCHILHIKHTKQNKILFTGKNLLLLWNVGILNIKDMIMINPVLAGIMKGVACYRNVFFIRSHSILMTRTTIAQKTFYWS